MKKILLLLLFIPLVSFGQTDNLNVNFNSGVDASTDVYGLKYLGNGRYSYGTRAGSDLASLNGQERKATKAIEKFAGENTYKVVNTDRIKLRGGIPYVKIIFDLYDNSGSLILNKDDAKKQLIELKEYLDLGIITQEEFDTKAVSLKKILLGN